MAQATDHTKPFIVDKNLGTALDIDNAQLTETTSDGTPVVVPTQEQKYLFDMRGWLLVPGCCQVMNSQRCRNSVINSATNRIQSPSMNVLRSGVPCNALPIIRMSSVSSTNFLHIPRYPVKSATASEWNRVVCSLVLSGTATLDRITATGCSVFPAIRISIGVSPAGGIALNPYRLGIEPC